MLLDQASGSSSCTNKISYAAALQSGPQRADRLSQQYRVVASSAYCGQSEPVLERRKTASPPTTSPTSPYIIQSKCDTDPDNRCDATTKRSIVAATRQLTLAAVYRKQEDARSLDLLNTGQGEDASVASVDTHVPAIASPSHQNDTYENVFKRITNADLSEILMGRGIDSPPGQIDMSSITEHNILAWRTRFHCAAYSGDLDQFCVCCKSISDAEQQLRYEAIEIAALVYQKYTLEEYDVQPHYWSALLHARNFLEKHCLSLADVMCQLKEAKEDVHSPGRRLKQASSSRVSPSESKATSYATQKGGTTSLTSSKALLYNGCGSSSLESELEPHTQGPDMDDIPDNGPGKPVVSHPVPSIDSPELSKSNSPSNTGKPFNKRSKKKKKKKVQALKGSETHDLLRTISETTTNNDQIIARPFLLTSGEVFFYQKISDIPDDIFDYGEILRRTYEECFSACVSIPKALEMRVEVLKEIPSWDVDYKLRCIDVYIAQMREEQRIRCNQFFSIAEIRSLRLHGITNERTRLCLGHIAPDDFVTNVLEISAERPKADILSTLSVALAALYDFTIQQFWNRYHLVPSERIILLDRLKRKLNGLGGRFILPGTRKVGQGFREIFESLQEAQLQDFKQHQTNMIQHNGEIVNLTEAQRILRHAYEDVPLFQSDELQKGEQHVDLMQQSTTGTA